MNKNYIKFLGSGGAFTLNNWHSNLILHVNGRNLLIDCGTDIRHSLNEACISYKDIDGVYISHLHGDHAGGLEYMGFATYFTPNCGKPDLFISKSLVGPLWANVLSGSMGSVQGKIVDLNDYFNVKPVGTKGKFTWQGIHFQMVQTLHIMNGFSFVPSFGLIFKINEDQTFFITADSQHCPSQIMDFYKMANVIFHDCESGLYKSGVHAHFTELETLPIEIKSKMWLYHHNDITTFNAHQSGFKGFVQKGQSFE